MKKIELISKYLIKLDKRILDSKQMFWLLEEKNLKNIPSTGNFILNKYLHILQMIYLAFYKKKIFENDVICFDNGGVILEVWKNWKKWTDDIKNEKDCLEIFKKFENNDFKKEKEFLDKFIEIFKVFPKLKLLEISHYDKSWKDKFDYIDTKKTKNIMNMEQYKDEYSELWKEWKYKFE